MDALVTILETPANLEHLKGDRPVRLFTLWQRELSGKHPRYADATMLCVTNRWRKVRE